jgi:hypothetical protein
MKHSMVIATLLFLAFVFFMASQVADASTNYVKVVGTRCND